MLKELFVEEYGRKIARALNREMPKFDSRFVASGLDVNHEKLLLAIVEHTDELEAYDDLQVKDGVVLLDPAQVVVISLFLLGIEFLDQHEFLRYIVYRALIGRVMEEEGRIGSDEMPDLWGRAGVALGLLEETFVTSLHDVHDEEVNLYSESIADEALATTPEKARRIRARRKQWQDDYAAAIEEAAEADSDLEAIVNAHPGAFESIRS